MRDLGVPHAAMIAETGTQFMVRRAELDYLAPARVDDLVLVRTRVRALGAASAALGQDFERAETVIARLMVRLACVRVVDGRAVRMPTRVRDALAGLMRNEG